VPARRARCFASRNSQKEAAVVAERKLAEWELCYLGWDPAAEPLREALTTLGNGYFATRGAAEESDAGGAHYPGTYLAGAYDRLESAVADQTVEHEDLVNWPTWLPLTFRGEGGEWFALEAGTPLAYEQRLRLLDGVLSRRIRFRDREGREFELESRRIVDMRDEHVAAVEWVLTPLNWSGVLEIRSAIQGGVTNAGVARYRALDGHHVEVLDRGGAGKDAVFLVSRSRQSHIVVGQAIRTRVSVEAAPIADPAHTETRDDWVAQTFTIRCERAKSIRVEKVVAFYSSRDFAISEPRAAALENVHRIPDFEELLERQTHTWKRLWHRADLALVANDAPYAQLVLRLHIFHLLQTASFNAIGRDVGLPARGLHGEGYRGHIFWDELFTFPFLNLRFPELSRSLLLYRYNRLDEARYGAREAGYAGAMFPWQSGSDGREETQALHLNPKSGRWIPDTTHRQRHVNAAIAYNVWQYFQATADLEFLSFYGAEMLLEIARFWASIATYSLERERYEIHEVVGPDEFHTQYPGKGSQGIDNNAYTNVMAAWTLHTARGALARLARDRREELLSTLHITAADLRLWDQISRKMFVPFRQDGIIHQFEGWDDLEELDWDALRRKHGDVRRLDRILEADGDDPNRYKATKQADALMLFFLFSAEELDETFERLGYRFERDWIPKNVQYYLARTSHGSTLSRVVHAWVLSRSDRKRSWRLFKEALAVDIHDAQGGTTPEGIHLGAMSSTVDMVQRCYTGLEMRHDVLWLNPRLPDGLDELRLTIRYRKHWLALHISHDTLSVSFEKGGPGPARIGFRDAVCEMKEGESVRFGLASQAA
jgi:trehalose/maltose hydrolase-like predicted phosphorylase